MYDVSVLTENQPLNGNGGGIGKAVSAKVMTLEAGSWTSEDIHFSRLRSRSVLATWSRPQLPNVNIKYYRVVVQDIKTNKSLEFKEVNTYALLYILEPETTYLVTVIVEGQGSDRLGRAISREVTTLKLGNDNDVNVQVEATGKDSIRVTWEPPRAYKTADIRHYSLYLLQSSGALKTLAQQGTTGYTLNSLSPFTSYTVVLKLVPWDLSKLSEFGLASAKTWPTVGQEVQNLQFSHVTPTSVKASWNEPSLPQGLIDKYHVEVKDTLRSENKNFTTTTPSIILTDLKPATMYDVSVLTENQPLNGNGGGIGKAVSAKVMTLEAGSWTSEDIHFSRLRSRSVLATWSRPQLPNVNIKYYRVVVQDIKTNKSLEFKEVNTYALLYILEPETTYLVTVIVEGQGSDRLGRAISREVTTLKLGNDNDVNVQVEATGKDSIRVTWEPPRAYKTADIRHYSLYLLQSSGALKTLAQQGTTGYTLNSLSPFTSYTVVLKLVPWDLSKLSEFGLASAKTWPTVGQEVQNLQFSHVTPTSVKASWNEPSLPQGLIDKYHVEVKDTLRSENKNFTTTTPSIILTDLKPATMYDVSVLTENQPLNGNGGGIGKAVSAKVMTLEAASTVKSLLTAILAFEFATRLDRSTCGRPTLPPAEWHSLDYARREAVQHSWPWTVGLYTNIRGGYPYCGGTLVAPEWIITAAHCVEMAMNCTLAPVGEPFSYKALTNATLFVRIGDHNLTKTEASERDRVVQNITIHPQYRVWSGSSEHDIALLQLEKPIVPDEEVGFVCLPRSDSTIPTTKECTFAGWGSVSPSSSLSHQNSPVLTEGRVIFKTEEFCNLHARNSQSQGLACLATRTGNPCWGDSGAGIYCLEAQGQWMIHAAARNASPETSNPKFRRPEADIQEGPPELVHNGDTVTGKQGNQQNTHRNAQQHHANEITPNSE
ncbi:hypothetical protein SprV_0502025000 [Sparganum proliferum]